MGEARRKLEEKKAEFEANPENFININDCLLVVQRIEDEEGKKRFAVMNNCRSIEDVFMADGFAKESCQNRRDQIRVIQAQQKSIIVPNGNKIRI